MSNTVPEPTTHKYTGREKEYKREWYLKNRDRLAATWKEQYKQKRTEILERIKNRVVSKEERLRRKLYLAGWHKMNKGKVLVHRQRRAASGEHRKYHKKWRDKNRARLIAYRQRRRALKRAAAVNLRGIQSWMIQVKSKSTAICYYCQETISTKQIHFDHIVPLVNGGAHSVENLCVSCADCNRKKHAKSITAFVVVGQQLLTL